MGAVPERLSQWVAGEPAQVEVGETVEVINPGTGEVTASLTFSTEADIDWATEQAREAQSKWAKVSLAKRSEVMFKMRELVTQNQDRIARVLVEEHGKNYSDAIGEIQRGRETIDFACGITTALKGSHTSGASTGIDVHTLHQPVGTVLGVTPFNFPFMVPA